MLSSAKVQVVHAIDAEGKHQSLCSTKGQLANTCRRQCILVEERAHKDSLLLMFCFRYAVSTLLHQGDLLVSNKQARQASQGGIDCKIGAAVIA